METRSFFYRLMSLSQRKGSIVLVFMCLLFAPLLIMAGSRTDCFDYLPADSQIHGNFFLCSLKHTGKSEQYACQNFISRYGSYRSYFKAGAQPKAIAKITKKGVIIRLLWSEETSRVSPEFNFPPPDIIPSSAFFVGAGICKNEKGKNVPCSAFRLSAPRYSNITDYIVIYKPDGKGVSSSTSITLASNKKTMPAEMAFQIGLDLLKTDCCDTDARRYLEYAYQQFPESSLYQHPELKKVSKKSK